MSESNGTGPSGQLGGWWVASALVVAVVVGSLAFVLLRPHPTTSQGIAAPGGTATATSSESSGESSPAKTGSSSGSTGTTPGTSAPGSSDGAWADTGCNGTSGPVVAPASVMRDVTWSPFLTSAIPSSPTLGPARVRAGSPLRQCFQHSPAGALMAAANIELALNSASGTSVIQTQYVPGPGQTKALADRAADSTPSVAQIIGYQLVGCTASACNVGLALFGGGYTAVGVVPMTWRGGDWLVDGAQEIPDPGLVTALPPGFTAWGPAS